MIEISPQNKKGGARALFFGEGRGEKKKERVSVKKGAGTARGKKGGERGGPVGKGKPELRTRKTERAREEDGKTYRRGGKKREGGPSSA